LTAEVEQMALPASAMPIWWKCSQCCPRPPNHQRPCTTTTPGSSWKCEETALATNNHEHKPAECSPSRSAWQTILWVRRSPLCWLLPRSEGEFAGMPGYLQVKRGFIYTR